MFGLQLENTIVIFEIKTLKFAKTQSFVQKVEVLKFWTKWPYLGSIRLKFQNIIVIFETSSSFEFFKMQSFLQHKKTYD